MISPLTNQTSAEQKRITKNMFSITKGIYALLFITLIFSYSTVCAQYGSNLSADQQGARASIQAAQAPFFHGVASGDPTSSSVMLWTRVTPDSNMIGEVEVEWQIATDINFQNTVNFGSFVTNADRDYTVKVDVCGLSPDTYYYFVFRALESNSVTGRTKTAPVGDNDSARFAVVSCANYEGGYFNAYEEIANRNDVDAVIHLGDYYYEYEVGGLIAIPAIPGRDNVPAHEIISLSDYRIRHSHYKLDAQLQRVHQLFPFIVTWDDHEVANNSWKDGADNHQANEGPYDVRKGNSHKAYDEWMPIRYPYWPDTARIFRKIDYGDLLDLLVIDSRHYKRDAILDISQASQSITDTSRTMLGKDQLDWLKARLMDTTSQWKVICQQVMMGPLEAFGVPINMDAWDGYAAERIKLSDHIIQNSLENLVVLTGDIHTSWAMDIPGPNYNSGTGAGSLAVEYVCPSVTTQSSPINIGTSLIQLFNPHIKYTELSEKGFNLLEVNKQRAQNDFHYVSTIQSTTYTPSSGPYYYVNEGESWLNQTNTSIKPRQNLPTAPSTTADQTILFPRVYDSVIVYITEDDEPEICFASNIRSCPSKWYEIILAPELGMMTFESDTCLRYTPELNACGWDTIYTRVCSSVDSSDCDTTFIAIHIDATFNTEVFYSEIKSTETGQLCFTLDDLSAAIDTIHLTNSPNAVIDVVGDTCLTYAPDSTFCGYDTIMYVACDQANPPKCDTVIWILKVKPPTRASYVYYTIPNDSSFVFCMTVDELAQTPDQTQIDYTDGIKGYAVLFQDSCVSYGPVAGFAGNDTVLYRACRSGVIQKCDSVFAVITVTSVTSIEETDPFYVIGVFPNPISTEFIIQHYQVLPGSVDLELLDSKGAVVMRSQFEHDVAGLKYMKVKTDDLPAGNYIVRLSQGSKVSRFQVVKGM